MIYFWRFNQGGPQIFQGHNFIFVVDRGCFAHGCLRNLKGVVSVHPDLIGFWLPLELHIEGS